MSRIQAEWRRRVVAEYRSAALTAAVLHGGIAIGLPEPLLHTALRVVRDELDHAALAHTCLTALGGADEPVPLDARTLWSPSAADPLADLVDRVVRDLCVGETLAVPLFQAMRQRTTHPAVLPVLTRVLADEAIHRQFGWDALDALLTLDAPGVRARASGALPMLLTALRGAYAPDSGDAEPLTDPERAAGLLAHEDYRRVFHQTLREDLFPRFELRGIAAG